MGTCCGPSACSIRSTPAWRPNRETVDRNRFRRINCGTPRGGGGAHCVSAKPRACAARDAWPGDCPESERAERAAWDCPPSPEPGRRTPSGLLSNSTGCQILRPFLRALARSSAPARRRSIVLAQHPRASNDRQRRKGTVPDIKPASGGDRPGPGLSPASPGLR